MQKRKNRPAATQRTESSRPQQQQQQQQQTQKRTVAADGVYNNPIFIHAVSSQLGNTVHLQTQSGAIYEGIFTTFSPQFNILLEMAHRVEKDNENINVETVVEKFIFKPSDIVSMVAKDVDPEFATRDTFEIDTAISSRYISTHMDQKPLERWDSTGDSLDNVCLELDSNANGWDADEMFQKNEAMYGVQSTFDHSLAGYTMQIQKSDSHDFRKAELEAEKIAREIENQTLYEERADLENGDEEAAFAAVVRPHGQSPHTFGGNSSSNKGAPVTNASQKYVPPAKRKQGQQMGKLITPQTPPAPINSQPTTPQPVSTPPPPPTQQQQQPPLPLSHGPKGPGKGYNAGPGNASNVPQFVPNPNVHSNATNTYNNQVSQPPPQQGVSVNGNDNGNMQQQQQQQQLPPVVVPQTQPNMVIVPGNNNNNNQAMHNAHPSGGMGGNNNHKPHGQQQQQQHHQQPPPPRHRSYQQQQHLPPNMSMPPHSSVAYSTEPPPMGGPPPPQSAILQPPQMVLKGQPPPPHTIVMVPPPAQGQLLVVQGIAPPPPGGPKMMNALPQRPPRGRDETVQDLKNFQDSYVLAPNPNASPGLAGPPPVQQQPPPMMYAPPPTNPNQQPEDIKSQGGVASSPQPTSSLPPPPVVPPHHQQGQRPGTTPSPAANMNSNSSSNVSGVTPGRPAGHDSGSGQQPVLSSDKSEAKKSVLNPQAKPFTPRNPSTPNPSRPHTPQSVGPQMVATGVVSTMQSGPNGANSQTAFPPYMMQQKSFQTSRIRFVPPGSAAVQAATGTPLMPYVYHNHPPQHFQSQPYPMIRMFTSDAQQQMQYLAPSPHSTTPSPGTPYHPQSSPAGAGPSQPFPQAGGQQPQFPPMMCPMIPQPMVGQFHPNGSQPQYSSQFIFMPSHNHNQ